MASTLTVITGPMFSGKSEELIRILRRAKIAKKKILVVKPDRDTRTEKEIAARATDDEERIFKKSATFPAHPVSTKDEIADLIEKSQCDILGVDEAQFFEYWFLDFLINLKRRKAGKNLKLIVAGLDMDAWGRTFGIMGDIMAAANEVQKLTAICFSCGEPAIYTQKIGGSKKQIEVGDREIYEARCENCFEPVTL